MASPMPLGTETIGGRLCDPPFHSCGAEVEYASASKGATVTRMPPEAACQEAMVGIVDVVETQLVDYPQWRKRLLWMRGHQFGAIDRPLRDSDREAKGVPPSAGGPSPQGRNGPRSSPSVGRQ
jgi:hypothetical protein